MKIFSYRSLFFFLLCSCAPRYDDAAPVDYPEEHDSIEEDEGVEVKPLEPLTENSTESNLEEEKKKNFPPQDMKTQKERISDKENAQERGVFNNTYDGQDSKTAKSNDKKGKSQKVSSSLIWPIQGKILKYFGDSSGRKGKVNGIVIQVAPNLRIKAAASGIVKEVTTIPDLGKVLILSHHDGQFSVYSPLKEISVKKGAEINQGDVLGRTDRQPLWFRLYERKKGKKIAIDPLKFLP